MEATPLPLSDSISVFKLVLSLAFVLGLVLVSAYFLRRWQGARIAGSGMGSAGLAVISSLPIGDRKYLMVIQVGGRCLLLGVTPQTISMLSEVELTQDFESQPGEDFAGLFRKLCSLGKKKK